MRSTPWLLASMILCPALVHSASYETDYAKSSLTFTGSHAGNPFTGTIGTWKAEIVFDANALDKSSINATFDMKSLRTGNAMYDGTLPSSDWLNSNTFPEGAFTSRELTAEPDGSYTTNGTLTLRNITLPVAVNFRLSALEDPSRMTKASFSLSLDRLAFDIGKASDPKAEWVSEDIQIHGTVLAVLKP